MTGEGSHYQNIFSSLGGMDPYAGAISDVYQDLFGEGSYTGKGIYDIDAFVAGFGFVETKKNDVFLEYCKSNPLYNDAIAKHGEKVFEYEFLGKIVIEHGRIRSI